MDVDPPPHRLDYLSPGSDGEPPRVADVVLRRLDVGLTVVAGLVVVVALLVAVLALS